jgi:hypothetical protein
MRKQTVLWFQLSRFRDGNQPILAGNHQFARFIFANIDNAIQMRNCKNLPEGIGEVAQNERAVELAEAIVQKNQHVPGHAGKILDIAKVQNESVPIEILHEMGQLEPNVLNAFFIQLDVPSVKAANGDIADVLRLEAP